ncbi:MAG: hypothetical protein K6T91_01905 [Firmicutes bacterium]|nr:hypothetical protein [Bacillota bacterium]
MARPKRKIPETPEDIEKRIKEEREAEKLAKEEQQEIVRRAVGKSGKEPRPGETAQ